MTRQINLTGAGRRFDWLLDTDLPSPAGLWNTEVARTNRFTVLPSLGSLVPGWVLVIPRRPLLNLAALSSEEKKDLDSLVDVVRIALSPAGEEIFEFEHGSHELDGPMGCGVDQAHLHIVPLPFDLLTEASGRNGNIQWIDLSPMDDTWKTLRKGRDYLFARSQQGKKIIGFPDRPESQWFRKLIAQELGVSDRWNYRDNSGIENVRITLELFGDTEIAVNYPAASR